MEELTSIHLGFLIFVVSVFFPVYFLSVDCSREQYGLVNYLLSNYSKIIRPVQHHNDTIVVSVGVALNQLVDLVCRVDTGMNTWGV